MSNKKYTTKPRKADFKDDPVPPLMPEGDWFAPYDKLPSPPLIIKPVPRPRLQPKPPVNPKPKKKDKLPEGQSIA